MPNRTGNISLVTGGSGLLGSRLVRRLLNDGQKVRVLDTRYGELGEMKAHDGVEFIGIDGDELRGGMVDRRTVEDATRGVDVIYHLAINWDGFTWRHRLPLPDLFGANIRGTLNLLEAARSHKVKHFLFSSSSAVYGDTQRTISLRGRPLSEKAADEESACRPELWDGDPGPVNSKGQVPMPRWPGPARPHRTISTLGHPTTALSCDSILDRKKPCPRASGDSRR